MGLEGRVAMVTGGASGISRAMARALGTAGAHVWIADVNCEGAAQAVSELRAAGIQADAHDLDVTSRFSVETAVDEITRRGGRLDVLFNGAGVVTRRRVLDIAEEDWDRLLAINLKGTFLCSQAAARVMVEQGYGRIVNIASGLAQGGAGNADYAASKAGVIAFTRSFARGLRELKVDVTINAIAPGATDTPLWRKGKTPEQIERLLASGTIHQPGDMASAVVFLASEESWPISGHVLERG